MSVELTCASTRSTRRGRCLPKVRMFLFTAATGSAASHVPAAVPPRCCKTRARTLHHKKSSSLSCPSSTMKEGRKDGASWRNPFITGHRSIGRQVATAAASQLTFLSVLAGGQRERSNK